MLRGLKIETFWAGPNNAAVSVPFGDFFDATWAYECIAIRPFCKPGGQELQLLHPHAV